MSKPTIILILFIVLGCSPNNSSVSNKANNEESNIPSRRFSYNFVDTSEISGILTYKMFWGPPNYGEDTLTDSKEIDPILILDHPINIIANKDDDVNESKYNVSEIQVITYTPLDNLKNKKISIKGIFFSSISGHHHTDALIERIK